MLARALSLAALAQFAGATDAQPTPLSFQEAPPGLPHPTVTSLARDPEGFLWAGTLGGLARFDGETYTVYRHDPTAPSSLINDAVNVGALAFAPDGTLLVGTEGGLCRTRPGSGRFTCWPLMRNGEPGDVTAVAVEPTGTVWAGTTYGLYRLQPGDRSPSPFGPGLPHTFVRSLTVTSDGTVWAGTTRGLAALARGATRFSVVPGLPERAYVAALVEAPSGGVFVGLFGGGAYHVRSPRGPTHPLPPPPTSASPSGTGPGFIIGLHLDATGRTLWAGTWGGGLLAFDPSGTARTREVASSDLPSSQVGAILVDPAGTLWVGTWAGLTSARPPPPGHWLRADGRDGALSHPIVTAIVARGRSLYVGTENGLNRCDARTLHCTAYHFNPAAPNGLCSDHVTALWNAPEGVYVGTSGEGVCRLDPASGRFTVLPTPHEARYVYALGPGPDGLLGVAGALGFVGLPRSAAGHERMIVRSSAIGTSPTHLATLPGGEVWVASLGRGLCLAGPAGCSARRLPDARVEALAAEGNALWAAGAFGVIRFDGDGRAHEVLGPDALPDPSVGCLAASPDGMWATSQVGLLRFAPRGQRITYYGAAVGLPQEGFVPRACARLPSGVLAFGTLDGLLLLDPTHLPSPPPVRLALTLTRSDGRPLARLRNGAPFVGPGDGGPLLHVAIPGLPYPESGLVQYRLAGLQREWSPATRPPRLAFPPLPPGRYTVEVRAPLFSAATSLPLVVRPPWWRTLWARALALLTVVALAFTAYRTRVRALLRVEATRRQIADDLHDDVGSRLGGLALALDVTARTLPGEASDEVVVRAEEARELLADLRDTVWVVDGSADTLADLAERVRIAAERMLPHATVVVESEGDLSRALDMQTRRHLLFFCKEALHNAARHGHPHRVRIVFSVPSGGSAAVQIVDDGTGFDTSGTGGHGLHSLRRRSEALGGAVSISSSPRTGTTISLTFPN